MITINTRPRELVQEFREDQLKSMYWWHKKMGVSSKMRETAVIYDDVSMSHKGFRKRTDPVFYESANGNKWMMWGTFFSRGMELDPLYISYGCIYQLTDPYMHIMLPTSLTNNGELVKGVTIYTSHLFMRMHERAGIDITDCLQFIRNFTEECVESVMDTRPPREGEHHKQIVCRLPGSWLRGHIIEVSDSYLIYYRTFYTDRTLTPYQRRDLKRFSKFANRFKTKEEMKEYFTNNQEENGI